MSAFDSTPPVSFTYDAAGRMMSRNTDTFAYNTRSELTPALLHTNSYGCVYDPIGQQKNVKSKTLSRGDRDFEAARMRGARSGIPRHSGNCHRLVATANMGYRGRILTLYICSRD